MIVVTGATGQLGRLVIEKLLESVPAGRIVAAVRDPAKAADLAACGVQVRTADYTQPATLDTVFAGAGKLLLVSSSAVGQRVAQHRNVIDAPPCSGVRLVPYTSVLHAETSPLGLATENRETEAMLRTSGPEADYRVALIGFGLPEPIAAMLADSDAGVSRGGLFDDGRQLSSLIGRPTTPMRDSVAAALAAAAK